MGGQGDQVGLLPVCLVQDRGGSLLCQQYTCMDRPPFDPQAFGNALDTLILRKD